MAISARIICDSTNWLDSRLTTFILRYPRYIHGEFMTHRVFSRNGASTRGIPTSKIIESVKQDTVYPMWTQTQKGMQGEIIMDEDRVKVLDRDWEFTRDFVVNEAWALHGAGVHKQHANRILEPFQNYSVILTSTEWDNFFQLRDHKAAMPEIQILAKQIKNALRNSQPKMLHEGEWHLPFSENIEEKDLIDMSYEKLYGSLNWETVPNKYAIAENVAKLKLKICVARCARISYNNFDGTSEIEKDLQLFDNLVKENPKHLSPTEHIAVVPYEKELTNFNSTYLPVGGGKYKYRRGKYVSNLTGWIQLRKIIENNEL